MPNTTQTQANGIPKRVDSVFERVSVFVSRIVGSPAWFIFSVTVIVIWVPSRVFFRTDELWHLFINTFTTILTFLMMALLHASQSRWERKIEHLEDRQVKMLRLVEKETSEIKTNLSPNSSNGEKTQVTSLF